MRILFTRHGESYVNVTRVISSRGIKYPLTPTGREQASTLARKLEGSSITRIYSSPLLRTIETTVVVAHHLGVDYEVTHALRECDAGVLEGQAGDEAWTAWMALFEDWMKFRRWERRLDGGESLADIRDRFVPFVEGLIQEYQGTDANLLCVGHGGLYWTMLPLVLVNIDTAFMYEHNGFDYTMLAVSELSDEGLVCREWDGVEITNEPRIDHE